MSDEIDATQMEEDEKAEMEFAAIREHQKELVVLILESLIVAMKPISDGDRSEVFSTLDLHYCKLCGREQPNEGCKCDPCFDE